MTNNEPIHKNIQHLSSIVVAIAVVLALPSLSSAEEDRLKITSNQTEYFFMIGEQAVLPLHVDNPYDKKLSGTLSFSVTQSIQQQGMSYQSSNSNTQPLAIEEQQDMLFMQLGSSQSPSILDISLSYSYSVPGVGSFKTDLSGIRVNFVQDEDQKKSQQEKKESQTRSEEELDKQKEQQQKQAEEAQKKAIEEQIRQQELRQQFDNRLQRSQVQTDTSALKKQLSQEISEQNKAEDALKETLSKNEELQEKARQLQKEGFIPKQQDIDAINTTDGSFRQSFENPAGDQKSITGKISNNTVSDILEHAAYSEETLQKIFAPVIENDPKFRARHERLISRGYNISRRAIVPNSTGSYYEYVNDKNETRKITFDLVPRTRQEGAFAIIKNMISSLLKSIGL